MWGVVGRVKKFSGLQVVIWKKLFTIEVHPHGRGSGANRLVNCMARLRLSRLSATEMGAARRGFFCGSTVTVLVEPGTWRLGIRAGICGQGGEDYDLTTTAGLATSCNTHEPCLSWLRPCRSASYAVRVCHIFQRIFNQR